MACTAGYCHDVWRIAAGREELKRNPGERLARARAGPKIMRKREMPAASYRVSRMMLLLVLPALFLGLAAGFSPSLSARSHRKVVWLGSSATPLARCRIVRGAQGMTARLRASSSNETASSRAGDDIKGIDDGKVGEGAGGKKFLFSRRLFNFFDKDKDGKVSVSEVASVLGIVSPAFFCQAQLTAARRDREEHCEIPRLPCTS